MMWRDDIIQSNMWSGVRHTQRAGYLSPASLCLFLETTLLCDAASSSGAKTKPALLHHDRKLPPPDKPFLSVFCRETCCSPHWAALLSFYQTQPKPHGYWWRFSFLFSSDAPLSLLPSLRSVKVSCAQLLLTWSTLFSTSLIQQSRLFCF